MKRKVKYFLALLWFSYLLVSSILLFAKGFLLTRDVQDKNSTCTLIKGDSCTSGLSPDSCLIDDIASPKQNGLLDRAHNYCFKSDFKVVLLIVDALRYDFTVFDENNVSPLPYENKLPVIKKVLTDFPDSSRLYKFIADPPTTTMQRLKALTTGSLPTFIDAGSNFATSEINEDNVIDQVVKNNGKIVFMGDDTWTSLYPNRFFRNYPYPSFDVWDLDTVDNGVKLKLFPELNNKDWNLLIGHFLGVDHCGHRYGPNHPEMARKLSEINNVIEEVIKRLDDESILYVIGDHGMTVTGDHGGESLAETISAMFVYSKRPLLSFNKDKLSVKQVDLVPTLSAALGVPIPFQNLGILITDALPAKLVSNNFNSWQMPLFWLWGNVGQVIDYLKSYSETAKIFDEEYLKLYYREFEQLRKELEGVASEIEFEIFSKKVEELLVKLRTLCEEVWIQFDALSISNGLTFFFLSIFFMFIISDGIPLGHLPLAIEGSFVICGIMALSISAIGIAILKFSSFIDSYFYSCIFFTNVLSHLMFLLPLIQNWGVISLNWYTRNKSYGIINLMCRFVLICNISVVFSNSFINEESSVLLFLLTTIILLTLFGIYSNKIKPKKSETVSLASVAKLAIVALAVLGLLRSSMYFWRCRVEQEWCFKSPHENPNLAKSESTKAQWGLSVMSLCLSIIITKMWLRKCGNLNGHSILEVVTKLVPTVQIVCIAGFWVLQRLAGNSKSITRTSNYLALSVYALTVVSVLVLLIRPVCVSIISRNRDVFSLNDRSGIASIFNKLKEDGNSEDTPIICGLGTVYSAVYIILATYVGLLVALVLGDSFSFALVIMVVVGVFFLFVSSILRIKRANSIDELLNVPTIAILGWTLLPQYFFFATGHQPAFPNIAWDAAFVGTRNSVFSHNYISGALIIINTFGTYILAGLTLPLLVITPFTLGVMMPSIFGKQKDKLLEARRGELILFENDRLAVSALFSLAAKYILGHAIKVFTSLLAVTIHCRHLMVWNIFAPKFIFEAIGLFVTLSSVLVGYLIFLRVHSQVEKLVRKINKFS